MSDPHQARYERRARIILALVTAAWVALLAAGALAALDWLAG